MKIEVSIGELIDKLTILSIKLEKFKDSEKRKNVQKEYSALCKELQELGISEETEEFKSLKSINLKLWDIEDEIRTKESKQEFDENFIQLSRSVYYTNDERAAIKRQINLKYNSDLVEEKEYIKYQ